MNNKNTLDASAAHASADLKYLTPDELEVFTESFKSWAYSSSRPEVFFSRMRVWLIFLVIRATGAKLGEVLSLDEEHDLDLEKGEVSFVGIKSKGIRSRQVKILPELAKTLKDILSMDMFSGFRGNIFKMDGGYIRRKFRERAMACGLPKELANPRVLRRTRAVELLRLGIPLSALKIILGYSGLEMTAQYLDLTESEIQEIIGRYMHKEAQLRTSARNIFWGNISSLEANGLLAKVVVSTASGYSAEAIITETSLKNLGLKVGMSAALTIKAPLVNIIPDNRALYGTPNVFSGKIIRIDEDAMTAQVVISLADGMELCSVTSVEIVNKSGLRTNEVVLGMFSPFSAVINTELA